MRWLLPAEAGEVNLDEAYGWPPGRRLVRANMVTSVDGAAVLDDVSGTLSGPADRRVFSVLRGLADVILVGAGTARREGYGGARPNPARQQRRQVAGQGAAPPIAVVSHRLDLDPGGRLFTDFLVRPLVLTCSSAPADRRRALAEVAEVLVAGEEQVDLGLGMQQLEQRGYLRVLCEGGPRLLADLVAGGHLDELCHTVSPLLTAGPAGRLLDGPVLARPTGLTLAGALEEDGTLFLRYAVRPG